MKAVAAAFLLLAAGAPGHAPIFPAPAPPVFQPAPTPAPLAPATSPAPGPAPPMSTISPLLLGPGASQLSAPAPGPAAPSSIDQQELRAYRGSLLDQQRALEQEGVSPADERYREIQQQLQQLDNSGSP